MSEWRVKSGTLNLAVEAQDFDEAVRKAIEICPSGTLLGTIVAAKCKGDRTLYGLIESYIDISSPAEATPTPTLSPEQISAFMKVIGSRGGKIGGRRRAENMSAEERSRSASHAALKRWHKLG